MLFLDFPGGSDGKESACTAGDLGSIPGLGRSFGGRHGNPLHYSLLENPHGHDWVTKHTHRGGLNNRNVFLIVLEAVSLRSGCRHGWFLWRLADGSLLIVSSNGGENSAKSLVYGFYKGTNPLVRAPPSWPHLILTTSQRSHPQTVSFWRLGLQHKEMW